MDRDLKEAHRLAIEGANRAANHAGDQWKDYAWRALLAFLENVRGEFIMEDVRWANPQVPEPPDNRAWGQIALRAKRAGLIEKVGNAPAKDKGVHGSIVTLWVKVDNTDIKRKALGLVLPHFPDAKITAVRDAPVQDAKREQPSPPKADPATPKLPDWVRRA